MKKIILFVLSVFITFNGLLSYTFTQGSFSQQRGSSIGVAGVDDDSFGSQRGSSIGVAGGNDSIYNDSNSVMKSGINWLLGLYGLYTIGKFIISPSYANIKNILYIGVANLVVKLMFSYMDQY